MACPHIRAGPAKHHSITPSTYFGPGVVQNIQDSCTAYEPSKLFVNAALTPVQQRNLEMAVGVPVLDRVGLIIDIFAQRARTREARLQVLAQQEVSQTKKGPEVGIWVSPFGLTGYQLSLWSACN